MTSSTTRKNAQPNFLAVAFLCAGFVAAVGSFWWWLAYTLAANDTAWLLRSGQYILAEGKLPQHDIFSWTCPDKPWVLYQWLYEVVLGLIFNAFTARGLWVSGLLTGLVSGIIYFYFLPRQWSRLRLPIAIAFPFMALALSPTWFFIRPQLVSHLFVVLFINACEKFRRTQNARCLWYLPLLTIIWANCHPLWIVGFIILGVYMLPYGLNFASPKDGKRFPAALAILLACYLAVLVNPYGVGLVLYEVYFNSTNNFKLVNELRPLVIDPPIVMYPFLVYLAIAAATIIWRLKAIPWTGRILAAMGILWSLSMNKFAPIGALIVWPYFGMALASLRDGGAPSLAKIKSILRNSTAATRKIDLYLNKKKGWRLLIASLLISVVCFMTRVPTWTYAITVFAYGDVDTFKYLATHGYPHRHIFNDEPTGSLMIFFNVLPVFCDGRVDFYGKEFCEQWVSCITGDPGWQEYLDSMKVDEIVIRNSTGLFEELKKSDKWICVYDSKLRSIWLRNDETGQQKLRSWLAR